MPADPLTPPNEHTSPYAVALDLEGVDSALAHFEQYGSQHFASPVSQSNGQMGGGTKSELDPESEEMSDADPSMSDGGAPLTMTSAHAAQLDEDVDVDMVDAQMMGHDNSQELPIPTYLPTTLGDAFHGTEAPPADDLSEGPALANPTLGDVYMHEMGNETSLPNTMSAVSLQLQHFQDQHLHEDHVPDGQDHAESVGEAEEPHSAVNSTPSILLPYLLAIGAHAGHATAHAAPQLAYVSLAEIVMSSNAQVLGEAQNASHPGSTEGPIPLPALSAAAVPPLSQPSASILPSTGGPTPHPLTPDGVMFDVDFQTDADQIEVQDSRNHHLVEFLLNWNHQFARSEESRRRPKGIAIQSLVRHRNVKVAPVQRRDLQGERCDIQRIDWSEIGVTRGEARQMRRHTYKNYTSIPQRPSWHPRLNGARLCDDQNFFRFRRMDFEHRVHLSHFQLRNLLACATRDHIFYAAHSKVMHCSPQSNSETNRTTVAMDLTDPVVQPFHSVSPSIHITTLSEGHDIVVAGGYDGEYSLMNLKASKHTKHTEGLITDHQNSITNHVQVHLSRGSSLPMATFASNDSGVRILDINTNKFVAEHHYDHAINCTAISPDQRLRVLVGDTRQVMICNAATGEVLQSLEGHRDYGFACDWADDGWTVATGNQDMQVKIWDARKWTNSSGHAQSIATIAADMAGVRKLKFSPLGSGKRVLVAAEPADIVNVIDAENFTSKQTLSFFGEIGGIDFTNDGQDLVVANCDPVRGGLMEFERCDHAGVGTYGLEEYKESRFRTRVRRGHEGYDWADDDDDLTGHPQSRGTYEQRRRKPAGLGINIGYF